MNGAELLLGADALARHGSRTALICDEERVSFAELAGRVGAAAGVLEDLGLRPGERLLILMRDTPDMAVAWLAALRIGAVAVALNPKLAASELQHVAEDSSARLAIVDECLAASPFSAIAEITASEFRVRAQRRAAAPALPLAAEAPAFMLYSSGTTGHPKGIVHAHRSIAAVGGAFRRIGIGAGDCVLTTSKHFFAYGLEHGLLATLAAGAASVLHPDWPDAGAVIELVSRHRPAAMFSVPTIYRRLLAEPRASLAPLRSVRRFVSAGERLSRPLVEQWQSAVGAELLNLYGMSETFCACMMTPPGTSDGLRTGVPFDTIDVELRDARGDPPLPGEPGILWVRHPAQASGYANLPRESQAQFRDGWFCSRDLFSRDAEGHYIHQGRTDELVKIAGQWVHPGELEEIAALETAVSEAACVPVPDADGLERLALFVTAKVAAGEAERAVREACERLPRHKRPKWVRAVEELPRTATGKVQRYKLREILARELAAKD